MLLCVSPYIIFGLQFFCHIYHGHVRYEYGRLSPRFLSHVAFICATISPRPSGFGQTNVSSSVTLNLSLLRRWSNRQQAVYTPALHLGERRAGHRG